MRVINNLYEYYCADVKGEDVSTTTRCPNLPSHLICGVHDVASTFKRILGGLPGGILGSLTLFDALVAIHSQLHSYAETTRTKETKLRARLIALAISTVESKHQRELICAVFGLLCLVGRAAEMAPREDESGRPLPTSDLMGYNALSIIFGPLLVGDLLRSYSMKLADPAMGLIILPLTPCKSGKHRRVTKAKPQKPTMLTIDRVLVANDIAEMLLVHWRDVVRHLKSLGANRKQEAGGHVWTGPDHSRQEKHETEQRLSVPATTYVQGSPDGNTVGLGDHLKKKMSSLAIESPNPSASEFNLPAPDLYGYLRRIQDSMYQNQPSPAVITIIWFRSNATVRAHQATCHYTEYHGAIPWELYLPLSKRVLVGNSLTIEGRLCRTSSPLPPLSSPVKRISFLCPNSVATSCRKHFQGCTIVKHALRGMKSIP